MCGVLLYVTYDLWKFTIMVHACYGPGNRHLKQFDIDSVLCHSHKYDFPSYLISLQSDTIQMELLAELGGALQVPADERLAEDILHCLRVLRVVL